MGNLPSGPYFERKEFEAIINDMKAQEEYTTSPFRPVHEVLVHSFIHPKNPHNPATISTGVLTGGAPLYAFVVGDGQGLGDLWYYVYDTRVIEHREDGTWVVEHKDLVLVKAQLGVGGYVPDLKKMVDGATKIFAGYTKFTPGMIHPETMLKYTGCMHIKVPEATRAFSLPVNLVDIICDHRVLPHMSIAPGTQKILHAGLPGRLLDYFPRVEFMVWRKDLCPENEPITEYDKKIDSEAHERINDKGEEEKPWDDPYWPKDAWPITDTLFQARDLHQKPENKSKLIERENHLREWSEEIFAAYETRKLWKDAVKRNPFKPACLPL